MKPTSTLVNTCLKASILFVLIFVATACEKEKKKAPFGFLIEAKVKEDDAFRFFYATSENEGFSPKNSQKKKVRGKNEFQPVLFEFNLKEVPQKIRFDVGENQFETPIAIKYVQIYFKKDTLKLAGEALHRFFRPNQFIKKTGPQTFLRQKKEGRYDPFFVASPLLQKKIELVF